MKFWIIMALLGLSFALVADRFHKVYTVRVTFCDNRKPITIKVYDFSPPNNDDISNSGYWQPLTTWNDYLNVCELKTIAEEDMP